VVTQAVAVLAVGVNMWGLAHLGVTMIPGGGIPGFASYFLSKDRTLENFESQESCTNGVQYGFQWHSVFFLSSKK